jgi:hypothetical protein
MSKTETQSDALELAEFFGSMKKSSHRWYDGVPVHEKAAAELRRLDAENKALRERLEAPTNSWHAPGLGEVHNDDHSQMIYCTDGDDIVDDKLANRVRDALNAAAAAKNGGAA